MHRVAWRVPGEGLQQQRQLSSTDRSGYRPKSSNVQPFAQQSELSHKASVAMRFTAVSDHGLG